MEKVNIELSDSNTYNALIELGILVNAVFTINYNTKTINYKWKEDPSFNKNYLLSPTYNLESLSLNYNGNEMSSLLFVEGGEDDYGLYVSVVPYLDPISSKFVKDNCENTTIFPVYTDQTNYYTSIYNNPSSNWSTLVDNTSPYYEDLMKFLPMADRIVYLDNFLLNIDYFKNNYLINETTKSEIISSIKNELRIINSRLQYWTTTEARISSLIDERESLIDTYADFLVDEDKSGLYTENLNNFNKLFDEVIYTYSSSTATAYISELQYRYSPSSYSGASITFPVNITIDDGNANYTTQVSSTAPIYFSYINGSYQYYYEASITSFSVSEAQPYFKVSTSSLKKINLDNVAYLIADNASSFLPDEEIWVSFDSNTVFSSNKIDNFTLWATSNTYATYILIFLNGRKYKALLAGTDGTTKYYYRVYISSYLFDFAGWLLNPTFTNWVVIDSLSYDIMVNQATINYNRISEETSNEYSYFEWLDYYGGIELIEEKLNLFKTQLVNYIRERIKLEEMDDKLLDSYIAYTGNWIVDQFGEPVPPTYQLDNLLGPKKENIVIFIVVLKKYTMYLVQNIVITAQKHSIRLKNGAMF